MKKNHICLKASQSSHTETSQLQFLVQEISKLLNIKLNFVSAQIQDAIKLHHNQEISLCQVQQILQQLRHLHYFQYHEDYVKISNYLTHLTVLHISKNIIMNENHHIIDNMKSYFDIIYNADKQVK